MENVGFGPGKLESQKAGGKPEKIEILEIWKSGNPGNVQIWKSSSLADNHPFAHHYIFVEM